MKYSCFDNDILSFEHLNAPTVLAMHQLVNTTEDDTDTTSKAQPKYDINHQMKVEKAPDDIRAIYDTVCEFAQELGDDVVSSQQKYYLAFKRVKNFLCVEVFRKNVVLTLKLDPKTEIIEKGFSRDMSNIGHYGTGDYQITITNQADVDRALPYIRKSYEQVS